MTAAATAAVVVGGGSSTTNIPGVQGWSLGHGPSSSLFYPSRFLLLDDDVGVDVEAALPARTSDVTFLSPSSMMLSRAMERQRRQLARSMRMLDDRPSIASSLSSLMSPSLSSPYRYELVDDDEKFQLSIDVPGVEMKDLDVSVDEENGYLTVAGQRTVSSKGNDGTDGSSSSSSTSYYSSKFSQTFALDDAVDLDKFSADLKNGVLVVTAPKDLKRLEETVDDHIKRIPITTTASTSSAEVAAPTTADSASEDTITKKDDDTKPVTTKVEKNEAKDDNEEEVLDLDNEIEQEPMPTNTEKEEHSKIHHVPITNEGEK